MAEDTQAPVTGDNQTAPAPAPAASPAAAEPATGQAAASTPAPATSGQEDYVFDPVAFKERTAKLPEDVRKDVEAFYKNLQGDYTKKTQAIAKDRRKIEAYDAFNSNPIQAMQRFAAQYGMQLTPAQAKAAIEHQQAATQGWTPESGDPKSWQDVISYAEQRAYDRVQREFGGKLQPIVQEFQNIRKQSIEQQLAEIDPGWQTHEDAMMANLQEHPTLAKDPAKLYRLSVPADVIEARATQRALEKFEAKAKGSQVSGTSTTNRKAPVGLPDKPLTFQEAIAAARAKLAQDGITKG